MYKIITGIILSGGKSRRMGTNKSLLKFGENTAIERVTELMTSIFERVIIITNEPELYTSLNLEIFDDIHKGFGPLSGIHSGLFHSNTDRNFIVSCDMPFIDARLLEFIINYPSDNSIVVPKADGFVQQLCGVYCKNILPHIEQNLLESRDSEVRNPLQAKRKCRVHSLIDDLHGTVIDMETEYPHYSKDLFLNMNSPEDYDYVLKKIF